VQYNFVEFNNTYLVLLLFLADQATSYFFTNSQIATIRCGPSPIAADIDVISFVKRGRLLPVGTLDCPLLI